MKGLAVFVLVSLSLLVAGCGSGKKASTTLPNVLPASKTPGVWAQRVVDIFLRPLNRDLQTLTTFSNPQVQYYIATKNATTIQIISARLSDLKHCSSTLLEIGPPPRGYATLDRLYRDFQIACTSYEDVSNKLLRATTLLSSGRTDAIKLGQNLVGSARDPSGRAATKLAEGIRLAQARPEFRRAGLKPSL